MVQGDSSEASRQERKKDETRKKIIDTAMALFEKHGFDTTTMEQIAEEADIARRTLYNHFPVKEAILSEYIQRFLKETGPVGIQILRQIPDTRTRLIQMLTKSLEWAEMHKDIYKIYFAYRMQKKFQLQEDPSIRSGYFDFVAEIVRLGQEAGELREDLPIEVLSNHLEFVYACVVVDMMCGKKDFSLRKSIEENVDIFLDGTRNRRGTCGK